jgi:oxygen-dependent protoporphyrinogen oxidase
MRVIVIGAGITGLSAALELRDAGADVRVLDASDRPGGVITTIHRDGFLVEAGPTSLSATPGLEALIDRLGLAAERVTPAATAKRRFIVRGGTPVALPSGPGSLVTSRALSGRAKWRLLTEPFVEAVRRGEDESIASIVRRRLGDEILTYLVAPFVSGIYAGDPERLSARHAMPLLYHAERRHGSLLLGGIREARARQGVVRHRGITSFRDGLATLPRAIAAALGPRVHCGVRVTAVRPDGDAWQVQVEREGARECLEADAVIYAGPAHALSAIDLPSEARHALAPASALPHPPVATLALGFRREAVAHPLDGFGMLCPAVEHRTILGAIFSSSLFPSRAPDGQVLITCFLGGERSPEIGRMSTAEVLPHVREDLAALLGVREAPTFVHHQHWARAIPQYELGHDAVVNGAARAESSLPGLYLTGQWRGGVALGECIAQGRQVAERVLAERGAAHGAFAGAA